MKSRGIIRRLDELGRVVIPREFRKMYKINVGDPLEISATENGDILVSRVDNLSDLVRQGQVACSTLSTELSSTLCVSSFERLVAADGQGKNLLIDKELPASLTKLLKNRSSFVGRADSEELGKSFEAPFTYVAIEPILSLDDCFGGIFAFSNSEISAEHTISLRVAARLIGESLAKY